MSGRSSKIRKSFAGMISWLSFLGAAWTVLIMLIIVADVSGRAFFNHPLTGTSEIVRNSIVGITFLQLAHVLREDRHIRTTIILDKVSPKGRVILNAFASVLGMTLFSLLFYTSWEPTWEALRTGEYEGEGALHVPTFPVHFLVLLGSLCMVLQFAINLFDTLRPANDSTNNEANDDQVREEVKIWMQS